MTGAESVADALHLLEENTFDRIVSDYDMPGQTGIDFLRVLREKATIPRSSSSPEGGGSRWRWRP